MFVWNFCSFSCFILVLLFRLFSFLAIFFFYSSFIVSLVFFSCQLPLRSLFSFVHFLLIVLLVFFSCHLSPSLAIFFLLFRLFSFLASSPLRLLSTIATAQERRLSVTALGISRQIVKEKIQIIAAFVCKYNLT